MDEIVSSSLIFCYRLKGNCFNIFSKLIFQIDRNTNIIGTVIFSVNLISEKTNYIFSKSFKKTIFTHVSGKVIIQLLNLKMRRLTS